MTFNCHNLILIIGLTRQLGLAWLPTKNGFIIYNADCGICGETNINETWHISVIIMTNIFTVYMLENPIIFSKI